MLRKLAFTILFIGLTIPAFSQRNMGDSCVGATWLGLQYGANMTSGDLADRYGFLNNLGIFAGYKTKKNYVFGLDANFIFGRDVRMTGLFDHLVDSYGNITDINGDIAIVQVLPRGLYANATVGKIFPVFGSNPNSGIYASVGAGYLVHRLRIETQDHVVPTLELDYRKGYDRLTSGINTSQFLGYSYMADQGFLNFYGGFYVQEGFTYNRRTINFDTPDEPVSQDMRLDIQYGIKVAWLIPIYKRQPKEFYYN